MQICDFFIQSIIISVNHTNFLLLKYIQCGNMFRLYRAIIQYIWDPKCLHRWDPKCTEIDMDVAWYNKVVCGVEEVNVILRGILRCFVVLKKYM